MEQVLWFVSLGPERVLDAAQLAGKIERSGRAPRGARLLPIDDILIALKKRFRGLTLDPARPSGAVDLPRLETLVTFRWSPRLIKATFEGEGFRAMEQVAKVLARFGCGAFYGEEFFAAEAPFPGPADRAFDAHLEALDRVSIRLIEALWTQFPTDDKRRRTAFLRAMRSESVKADIATLAAQILKAGGIDTPQAQRRSVNKGHSR